MPQPMSRLLSAALLVLAPALAAQAPPALMPLPALLERGAGVLRIDSHFRAATTGYTDARLQRGIGRALLRLGRRLDATLAPSTGGIPDATLQIEVGDAGESIQTLAEDESYSLRVEPAAARLTAPTVTGALRGLETLLQLVDGDSTGFFLPAVHIEDRPRFPWRGLLLDVSRRFLPPEVVRRTLDGMALVKLNVLHWHLSDDQGFRVESLRYPRLQALASDGRFYTQDEIRDLVAYASDRGIRVVPEFDMPGHATSWFVGYPELASLPGPYRLERRFGVFDPAFDPTREETYRFLEGFIGEMAGLFPDPYWHIGGDEVTGRQWRDNPVIGRFMRQRRLATTGALQTYFNRRLMEILTRHGKRMVGWDEIISDSLPPGTVVQSWRGTEYLARGTARGYAGILSAPWYLDHQDPADQLYLADPQPPGLGAAEAARVLGGEACMWAEHVDAETVDSRIWPRLAAIAERFWSPATVRDVDDMYRRLSLVSVELERVGLGHEAHTFRLLQRLTGRHGVQPLHDLLAHTMPVSFGQRTRLQRTRQLLPLTSLVDAARPDPWARSRLNRLAALAVGGDPGTRAAREELRRIFTGWGPLALQVAALRDSLPLAREGEPAAWALAALGALGVETLDHLDRGDPAAAWQEAARNQIARLSRPQGLLRLAGVEAVARLVAAAP